MFQRKSAAHVIATPASQGLIRGARRRRRAGYRWLPVVSLLLIALLGWGATHWPGRSQNRAIAASRHLAAAAAPAAKPAAGTRPQPVAGSQGLLSPQYSWDYGWEIANPPVGAPKVRARSAVLVDIDSRHVLFDRLAHTPMAPASTTKLTTAMVALDHASPDTTVTVPAEAVNIEPNIMGLSAGEQLTVRELLYGLMLDSGNDAAETLAATIMDDRRSFIRAMNQKAAALGLSDTHFTNPSGLDDAQQTTSAHDLAITAAYVYQRYPLIEQVVTTKQEALAYSNLHKAFFPTNLNKMLWTYPEMIGFKTGLTDRAGLVFVGGARRGSHTLVVVEMDDPLIFTDAAALLDYGFRREG